MAENFSTETAPKIVEALIDRTPGYDSSEFADYLEYCKEELPWKENPMVTNGELNGVVNHEVHGQKKKSSWELPWKKKTDVQQEPLELRSRIRAARSAQDILDVVEIIANSRTVARATVYENLQQELGSFGTITKDDLDECIDLAIRIWLMLNVRKAILDRAQTAALQWRDDESLDQFVKRLFPEPAINLILNIPNRVEYEFNAINIQIYGRMKIRWTTSLEDHLRLRFEDHGRVLRVFPYKAWLIEHLHPTGSKYFGYGPLYHPQSIFTTDHKTANQLFRKKSYEKQFGLSTSYFQHPTRLPVNFFGSKIRSRTSITYPLKNRIRLSCVVTSISVNDCSIFTTNSMHHLVAFGMHCGITEIHCNGIPFGLRPPLRS
jgi:hypothetical protein